VKFIPSHATFTSKSNSVNYIKIRLLLTKLQTKIRWFFLWPTVYIAAVFAIFLLPVSRQTAVWCRMRAVVHATQTGVGTGYAYRRWGGGRRSLAILVLTVFPCPDELF